MLRISGTLENLCFEIPDDMDDEPENCHILPFLDPETLIYLMSLERIFQINFYKLQTGKGQRMTLMDSCPSTEVLGCGLWIDTLSIFKPLR